MEETKQKNNKMKWIIIIIAAIIVAAALVVFLGKGDSSEPPKEKEYVKEDQIGSVFSDPDKFKDKYIKLKGQVFNVEENDGTYSLQVWYDVKNFEKDFIVDTDQKFEEDDYISIDGWITGSFTGESAVGGEVTCPRIQAVSAEETNYIDVAAPTVEEKTVNKTSSQYGVDVTIEKIEFAKDETRVYVKVKNGSKDAINLYAASDAKAIQDGKQIGLNEDVYLGDYDELQDEISVGASDTGIILFEKIDSDKPFRLEISAYSDDYDIEFKEFTFEIE